MCMYIFTCMRVCVGEWMSFYVVFLSICMWVRIREKTLQAANGISKTKMHSDQ